MALDPNRWTAKTQEAFRAAIEAAEERSNPEVVPAHLMAALLGQEGTVTLPVLERVGVAPLSVRNRMAELIGKLPRSYGGGEPSLGREASSLLNRADQERQTLGDEYLSVEHLLLALSDLVGVSREDLLTALKEVRGSHRVTSAEPRRSVPGPGEVRPGSHRRRPQRQARPGHRPGRGDPPGHPGPLPADQEQSRPDWRARGGQDGDR